MTLLLGLRLAVAGGRAVGVRLALISGGVAAAVVLSLFALTVMPALQGRIDRYAWHRTDAATPATAPDAALWTAVTDRWAGRNLIRVHIAALGPRPPTPPGVERLPAPGELLVSPALAELFRTVPADQLRDRFPGRVIGTIGPDGLVSPEELVGIAGRTPDQMRATRGVVRISGFERPGEPKDLGRLLGVTVALLAILLAGPVLVFVAMVARIGAARHDQRFAALRLAGASRRQTAALASVETLLGAVAGALLGFALFALLRSPVASHFTYEGLPFPIADLDLFSPATVAVLVGLPLIAVATTIVALLRIKITPLGVRGRAPARPPASWRLAPLGLGLAGVLLVDGGGSGPLVILAVVLLLTGLVMAGPWLCMAAARGLARISRRATTLIAARRIAADPYAAFRAVSGVALAVFVATVVNLIAAGDRPEPGPIASVVEISPAAPEVCAALGVAGCPAQSLRVPTDGSRSAEERIRTRVALADPDAVARTGRDLAPGSASSGWAAGLRLAMVFVLLVAACSLTVSVAGGVLDRRRSFAMLRAAGMRLSTLRGVTLVETGVPLVATAAGSFAVAMTVSALTVPRADWVLPEPAFLLSLIAGVLAALAIPLLAAPLTATATGATALRLE